MVAADAKQEQVAVVCGVADLGLSTVGFVGGEFIGLGFLQSLLMVYTTTTIIERIWTRALAAFDLLYAIMRAVQTFLGPDNARNYSGKTGED